VLGRLFGRHPLAANVDDALGVAHDEGPQLEPEEPAVADGQVVDARDPHRARLGVQAGRKGSECVHAATDAILGFQDERVVALPRQLEGGDQTRDAGADDDDPLGRLIARSRPSRGVASVAGSVGAVVTSGSGGSLSSSSSNSSMLMRNGVANAHLPGSDPLQHRST
jgi:hypothetical protein